MAWGAAGFTDRSALRRGLARLGRHRRSSVRERSSRSRSPGSWFAGSATIESSLYLGTVALVIIGAIVWGARLGDLNMGHLFFGAIAVFATPVAAVAVWSIWLRLRATGHGRLAVAILVFCVAQIEFGLGLGILRLQTYGPGSYPRCPSRRWRRSGTCPPDAKLAYACRPYEEAAFWAPQLVEPRCPHRSPCRTDVLPGRDLSRTVRSAARRRMLRARCSQSAPQRWLFEDVGRSDRRRRPSPPS